FPRGISEIEEAGLTMRQSKQVKSPSIEECVGWIECKLEFEKEAGDHILVIGQVLHAECKDEFMEQERFNVSNAKPVMHVRGRRFVAAERVIEASSD
ncbi:MAG: flavin reductase, partial [Dehalococcoidia bacterium]